jgi:hypothetical protein
MLISSQLSEAVDSFVKTRAVGCFKFCKSVVDKGLTPIFEWCSPTHPKKVYIL